MLQSFGFSCDDIKVLSYPDYFESNNYAYVRDERTFLVRKTIELLVLVVKLMNLKKMLYNQREDQWVVFMF